MTNLAILFMTALLASSFSANLSADRSRKWCHFDQLAGGNLRVKFDFQVNQVDSSISTATAWVNIWGQDIDPLAAVDVDISSTIQKQNLTTVYNTPSRSFTAQVAPITLMRKNQAGSENYFDQTFEVFSDGNFLVVLDMKVEKLLKKCLRQY